MEHVDEGQLHAWLDGELSSEERGRLEGHIAECAECGALLAEARGIVAASSRIISRLDDVPGGVIPAAMNPGDAGGGAARALASVQAERMSAAARSRQRTRAWWRRPQYAAAAGIAFIAVTTTLVLREQGVNRVADFGATAASDAAVSATKETALPLSEALPAPSVAPGASESSAAAPEPAATRDEPPVAPGQAVRKREQLAASAKVGEAARAADVASQASANVAAADAARTLATDSVRQRQRLSPGLDPDRIVRDEARRLQGERKVATEMRADRSGAGAAKQPSAPMPSAAFVPSPAAEALVGCYRLQRTDAARRAGLGERVALDAIAVGADETHTLYRLRWLDPLPAAGPVWSWTLSSRGEVVLLRSEGVVTARFPLAVSTAAQTGETSVAARMECPGA
ncbi:MAG: zf-HC2 domain-containing protein [Gemmatimonadaceae bacterium]